jgi:multimeric flavodoxin WrbA
VGNIRKEIQMKILVVNGSPRGAQGNTEILTKAFLAGAKEAGAEGEVVYLKDKHIEHCIGCFGCWLKTPGECVHDDDMPELHQKMLEADVTVYATPLYVYTVSGIMKDFMDRVIPLVQPFVEVKNGVCSHPGRTSRSAGVKSLLISNCGFPEQSHFDGLKQTFRCLFKSGLRNAGMICCSAGPMLSVPEMQEAVKWYVDATRQAGRDVVTDGRISEATQAILDKPLIADSEAYAAALNQRFREMGVKPIGE